MQATPRVLAAVGAACALQASFTYLPLMQTWFGSAPLPLPWIGISAAIGVAVLGVLELEKALRRARR